jgi:hypothetical protein
LWEDKAPSPVKRLRVVTRKMTLLDAANAVGCSLTAFHRLESRGIGSAELWQRVAAVFNVEVEAIKPIASARGSAWPEDQLALPWASSS